MHCTTPVGRGADLTTIDGVRVDYAKGWGLVRASNTTPVLVLRFEADDEAELRASRRVPHPTETCCT
jgi:phosphomannomutase/phosphoglucomutase